MEVPAMTDRFTPSDESLVALAADWHGGQSSVLYALASTGALTPGRPGVVLADLLTALIAEVRVCQDENDARFGEPLEDVFDDPAYHADMLAMLLREAQDALAAL